MARRLGSVIACTMLIAAILVATGREGKRLGAVAVAEPPSYLARGGTVSIEFDPYTLEELGWSLTARGSQDAEVALGEPATFLIEGSPTLQTVPGQDRSDGAVVGTAGTRGALLLTGLGDRVIIGNFVVAADADGNWTVTSTLGEPEDHQVVFELSTVMTDLSAVREGLRAVGEITVAESWANELGAPEAAGVVIGMMTLEVGLVPPRAEALRASRTKIDSDTQGQTAGVIGPDILIGDLYSVARYGRANGITAFSVGTNACNIGDRRASWIARTNQHPAILQSAYWLKEGRFEQIGMAWVKHGFYAVSGSLCSPCNDPTNGTQLGVGCSDPYSSYLNAVQGNMSMRSDVNAHTGYFPYPWTAPAPTLPIHKRLQVYDVDLNPELNAGALYFVEGHYVAADDSLAGNNNNSASYRRVIVTDKQCNAPQTSIHGRPCVTSQDCIYQSVSYPCERGDPPKFDFMIRPAYSTQRGQSAVRAWQDMDSSVIETDVQVPGEGLFILAAKATDLGNGFWHYEYALQNLNSDRSAGTFSVPIARGSIVQNIGFHDVDYHSGEPYDLTDWPGAAADGWIAWWTDTYEQNPNANALRYSTTYSFRFDADVPPGATIVTIGLFKPGEPTEVQARTIGPWREIIDCNNNGIEDRCDIDCGSPGGDCDVPGCGLSTDCNENLIPDECEPDCNENGVADGCDITDCPPDDLWCADCNGNTVPDGCEDDCDGDGIPDECDTYDDKDGDGIPDCVDLCPCTTPEGACVCPPEGLCCWPDIGLCLPDYSQEICVMQGGTPECWETPCRDGCLIGDDNNDGDRDLEDVGALQRCFRGSPDEPGYEAPSEDCLLRFDFDDDQDLDLYDHRQYGPLMKGPRSDITGLDHYVKTSGAAQPGEMVTLILMDDGSSAVRWEQNQCDEPAVTLTQEGRSNATFIAPDVDSSTDLRFTVRAQRCPGGAQTGSVSVPIHVAHVVFDLPSTIAVGETLDLDDDFTNASSHPILTVTGAPVGYQTLFFAEAAGGGALPPGVSLTIDQATGELTATAGAGETIRITAVIMWTAGILAEASDTIEIVAAGPG